ncbi:hypothetical protein AMK59_3328, partial [Oryctes borbonicus]
MGVFFWAVLVMVVVVGWLVLGGATSSTARYYLKFAIFGVGSLFSATSPIPLMLRQPKDSKNALLPAAGLRFIARMIGLKCFVRGKENIVKDSGCVVVINHQSMLDLIVLAELWPVMDRCTVISKKEIFYLWPFGLAAWLWGTIFIDRLNAERAQHSINSTGEIIRNRKARVLMFPEGTRSMKNKLLPFKKGAFHLAIASQCPVQPVIVSRYTFLGDKRFDSGIIDITILPPVETSGLVREDVTKLVDETYGIMSKYLESLSPSP